MPSYSRTKGCIREVFSVIQVVRENFEPDPWYLALRRWQYSWRHQRILHFLCQLFAPVTVIKLGPTYIGGHGSAIKPGKSRNSSCATSNRQAVQMFPLAVTHKISTPGRALKDMIIRHCTVFGRHLPISRNLVGLYGS